MCAIILVLLIKLHIVSLIESGSQVNEFCYVNKFQNNTSINFTIISQAHVDNINSTFIDYHLQRGLPFKVSGVTKLWKAVDKWSHSYFEKLFKDEHLFSSTFSTPNSPQFCLQDDCNKNVYYGIFLNNELLADTLANDFEHPHFISNDWWIKGNEWIHWGHPPCGAKRHMDLTCTSRVSVQIAGSKEWRLYPISSTEDEQWKKVLQPLSVNLLPGDALFWFPGWEHETEITEGISISLSLHFIPPQGSLYQQTFAKLLHKHVSKDCDWYI